MLYASWFVMYSCRSLRWLTIMEKIKRVCARGLGAMKNTHGGLDQEAEVTGVDHRWLIVGDTDKQVYMWS